MCGCRSQALIGRVEQKNPLGQKSISEKVAKSPEVLAFRQEPQHDVVSCLRELLERAERGQIRALAVAAHVNGVDTASTYALGNGDVAHLVCALERVKGRLLEIE